MSGGDCMLITDPEQLKEYTSEKRNWQGIPGIEVTAKGRMFAVFYSGGITEDVGNYSLLVKSDDSGKTWSEPIAVAYAGAESRAYDPCIWIDPQERLWFFYAVMPNHRQMGVCCNAPDADMLDWGAEQVIGHDVMLNKPIVLKDGRWLLPIAIWRDGVKVKFETAHTPKLSYVYESRDNGQTFTRLGGADVPNRSYDEHMLLERRDGSLLMFVRLMKGIGKSLSFDGGMTWTAGENTGLGGPNSRFFLGRLRSGNVILINHAVSDTRSNLTAFLSEDDGETFPMSLLLDDRPDISYPDLKQTADGLIYVIYDRERGAIYQKMRIPSEEMAKEILFCTFREEDIRAGKLISPDAKMRQVVSRLQKPAQKRQ